MEKTRAELTDFCLLIVPTGSAALQADEAVRSRFTFLGKRTRRDLAVAVAVRVQRLVDEGAQRLLSVTIAIEPDAIHGSVLEQRDADVGSDRSPFVIPLDLPA